MLYALICPSSGILQNNKEHIVSKLHLFPSSCVWWMIPPLLRSLEGANLDDWKCFSPPH
jgi:hypothetical protein